MANGAYNGFKVALPKGQVNLQGGAIKVLLVTSNYVFDPNDDFVSDVVPASNEVSGPGYSRLTLANVTDTRNNTLNQAEIGFDDVVWATISVGTVAGAVLFKQVTDDTDSILLWYVSFTKATNGGELRLKSPVTPAQTTNGALQIADAA